MTPDNQPPPDPTPWGAGDLALCLKHVEWKNIYYEPNPGPAKGQILTVQQVLFHTPLKWTALVFDEFKPLAHLSEYFVKLEPHQEDEEDREIIKLLREKHRGPV